MKRERRDHLILVVRAEWSLADVDHASLETLKLIDERLTWSWSVGVRDVE